MQTEENTKSLQNPSATASSQRSTPPQEQDRELGGAAAVDSEPRVASPELPAGIQQIAHADLTIEHELGRGGFGIVNYGLWHGKPVAVKTLQVQHLAARDLSEFQKEVKMLGQLNFPSIVRFYGACLEPGHLSMVMDYMPRGSLYDILHSDQDLAWPRRFEMGSEIALGLNYLHQQRPEILHRDLKSLNVLVDQNWQVKLCDFGLAGIKLVATTSQAAGKTSKNSDAAAGTTRWKAPELFQRRAKHSQASDVYALGMVLWELASRAIPFADAADQTIAIQWIREGEKEEIPESCPADFASVILLCWGAATERPSALLVAEQLRAANIPLAAAFEDLPVDRSVAATLPPVVEIDTETNTGEESGPSFLNRDSGLLNSVELSRPPAIVPNLPQSVAAVPSLQQLIARSPESLDSRPAATAPAMMSEAAAIPGASMESRGRATAARPYSPAARAPVDYAFQLTQDRINQFLQHVVLGEQDKAEAMLERNPNLTRGKGTCKDQAGRVFKDITGFQYALWALDWHMWEMILPYLNRVNPDAAGEQCQAQPDLTTAQGFEGNYKYSELIDALKTYIDQFDTLYKANSWSALKRLWIHGVGGAQRQVPAHVAQEYCHPDRSFKPTPDFSQKPLPRQLKTDKGDWQAVEYDLIPLGGGSNDLNGFAVYRGGKRWSVCLRDGGALAMGGRCTGDRQTLCKLFEVRTSQLTETRSILSSSSIRPGGRR